MTNPCIYCAHADAYQSHEVSLVWMDTALELDDELELPQFDFGEIKTSSCLKTYKTTGTISFSQLLFTVGIRTI